MKEKIKWLIRELTPIFIGIMMGYVIANLINIDNTLDKIINNINNEKSK